MPFKLVVQQLIPAGTAFTDLPEQVERKCCVGKFCGNTELARRAVPVLDPNSPTGASLSYEYVRTSNDDTYFAADTVDGLIARLNDPTYFPAELDEHGDELVVDED